MEQQKGEQPKLIITVNELAPMLGTTPGTIYKMIKRNEIPYRKIGRQHVFSLEGIQEWLKGQEKTDKRH